LYPVLYSGSRFGAKTGARRLGALLLRLRRPSGYGFQLRRTLRKCRAWHLGAGPTRSASPGVTRAGYGKFNKTEITTMYSNKVTLIGFLGNDAEVRTNDNRSFTTLSLATKSSYKKDGQYISHTEWHRCVIFGKLAEFAGTLKKGAHLQVEGELRSREYETKKVGKKAAQKKTIWEIRVNSILKLDRAEKASPDEQETEPQLSLEAAA
jgi:single-strand DNA-binding protein